MSNFNAIDEEQLKNFNTIDEEHLNHLPVIYSSGQSQKSSKSATHQGKNEHLHQQLHLKCEASDRLNLNSRSSIFSRSSNYSRSSNHFYGTLLGKPANEARIEIQPIQNLPHRSLIGQVTLPQINPPFESTLDAQNQHRQLSSRRSTQPCFTPLAQVSKLNQPSFKSPRKLRSFSISNPPSQQGQCSKFQSCKSPRKLRSASVSDPSWQQQNQQQRPNLKSSAPENLNNWPPVPTDIILWKETLKTLNRAGILSCSSVSTDL